MLLKTVFSDPFPGGYDLAYLGCGPVNLDFFFFEKIGKFYIFMILLNILPKKDTVESRFLINSHLILRNW